MYRQLLFRRRHTLHIKPRGLRARQLGSSTTSCLRQTMGWMQDISLPTTQPQKFERLLWCIGAVTNKHGIGAKTICNRDATHTDPDLTIYTMAYRLQPYSRALRRIRRYPSVPERDSVESNPLRLRVFTFAHSLVKSNHACLLQLSILRSFDWLFHVAHRLVWSLSMLCRSIRSHVGCAQVVAQPLSACGGAYAPRFHSRPEPRRGGLHTGSFSVSGFAMPLEHSHNRPRIMPPLVRGTTLRTP